MKKLSSIASIIPIYDYFLLDLWGVVHDGEQLYAGVAHTISLLQKSHKKIIFLSNAPRRAERAAQVLERLGIEKNGYEQVVTSGEVGYNWLLSKDANLGKKYFYIGEEKDHALLYNTDYQEVFALEEADFILNLGFGSDGGSSQDFSHTLAQAQKMNKKMLCLNPDLEVIKLDGRRFACAGMLAEQYIAIGGEVVFFGKPYSQVYDECYNLFGSPDKAKILAVGDSLDTDILGANRFGVDSALITGGILRGKSEAEIEEICLAKNIRPKYMLPKFGTA